MPKVLVVDDSPIGRALIARHAGGGSLEKVVAENGRAALELMETARPDVVLTDLVMPEMDGMQLVVEAKQRFKRVPIVIVTSQGSEEAAAAALKAGAAGYVPKNRIEQELAPTVKRLLDIAHSHERHRCLLSRMRNCQYHFVLDNDPSYLATLNRFLQDAVAQMGICDDSSVTQLAVALDEALVNAMFHGNLELSSELRDEERDTFLQRAKQRRLESPYRDRHLDIQVTLVPEEAKIVIRDEGPGFDLASLPDPTDSANLDKLSGRGVMMMFTFMDDVDYNETGNEVTLIKRREEPDADEE